MFVKSLAKTEMLKFWEFMFDFCKEDFSCVLGWLLVGTLGFLAVLLGLGVMISRLNRKE